MSASHNCEMATATIALKPVLAGQRYDHLPGIRYRPTVRLPADSPRPSSAAAGRVAVQMAEWIGGARGASLAVGSQRPRGT